MICAEDFVEPNYPAPTSMSADMSALVCNVEELKEQVERLGNIVDLGLTRLAEAQENQIDALDKIAEVAEWYREGWQNAYGVRREQILSKTDTSDTLGPRNFLSAEHLANNIQEAPVWIMAILRNAAESTNPRTGSSIYGAVQHLMLAARAHGIGATLTTLYASHEEDVKKLLGIPEDAMTMALIPLGYPSKGRWAQPKRQPVEDIAFMNHWGQSIS